MLHQLEFKLQVETQYKKGIDKMAKLYQADGDKKSRADAESKKIESERKIQLLQSALKRYKNLHILDDADEDDVGMYTFNISRFRMVLKAPQPLLVLVRSAPVSRANGRTTFVTNLFPVNCKSNSRVPESSITHPS